MALAIALAGGLAAMAASREDAGPRAGASPQRGALPSPPAPALRIARPRPLPAERHLTRWAPLRPDGDRGGDVPHGREGRSSPGSGCPEPRP